MSEPSTLEKILKNSRRALLIGIGGGGDIVGTVPTYDLLDMFGIECVFAGLPWERSVFDPVPGPRTFEETRHADKLNDVVWRVCRDTVTHTGVRFAEAGFSEVWGGETLLIGIESGPEKIAEGILDAARRLSIDLVVGLDVGGDFLAQGGEPGLMSPLADSIMTASLYRIDSRMKTMMALFGFGSDGELTQQELEASIEILARKGGVLGSWGITDKALGLMEKLIAVVPTEASRSPVEYAKGGFSDTRIRSGTRNVSLSMSSTVTFYFSTQVVYNELARMARAVSGARSLEEANMALHSLGVRSELDLEIEKLGGK